MRKEASALKQEAEKYGVRHLRYGRLRWLAVPDPPQDPYPLPCGCTSGSAHDTRSDKIFPTDIHPSGIPLPAAERRHSLFFLLLP